MHQWVTGSRRYAHLLELDRGLELGLQGLHTLVLLGWALGCVTAGR